MKDVVQNTSRVRIRFPDKFGVNSLAVEVTASKHAAQRTLARPGKKVPDTFSVSSLFFELREE
jgi:hypothetical protein